MIDPHTIDTITSVLEQRVSEVQKGLSKPVELYAFLHQLEKIAKEFKAEILDEIVDEVDKYGKEGLQYGDYKMTVSRTSRWPARLKTGAQASIRAKPGLLRKVFLQQTTRSHHPH